VHGAESRPHQRGVIGRMTDVPRGVSGNLPAASVANGPAHRPNAR
jgi:hypothetical protein